MCYNRDVPLQTPASVPSDSLSICWCYFAPRLFITPVVNEVVITVRFMKSDLFQNMLTALILMDGIRKYCFHSQ